jgi:phosphomannomutase
MNDLYLGMLSGTSVDGVDAVLVEIEDHECHIVHASTTPFPPSLLARVQKLYEKGAQSVDFTDGLSVEFADWRFNLRGSNTEPLVRLNVESRGNEALMREKTQELLAHLDA